MKTEKSIIMFSFLATLLNCSHFRPTPTKSYEKKLRSWNIEKKTKKPGELIIKGRVEKKIVKVKALRKTICVTTTTPHVQQRRLTEHSVPWIVVGPVLAGGALFAGSGGYFLGTAPSRPDIDDPYSRDELSKQGALGIGLPLFALGAIATGLGGWSLFEGQTSHGEPRVIVDTPRVVKTECGSKHGFP